MSGALNFALKVSLEVYPYEGGSYFIGDANSFILGCSTSKSISGAPGTFGITLSPGGPTGTASTTWTKIITPLSFVVISMMRGNFAYTVMAGVVTSVAESQGWSPSGAQRITTIQGEDLTYFFTNAAYYNLAFLLGSAAAAAGGVPLLDAQSAGLIQGSPAQLAKTWYTTIMAGSPNAAQNEGGILSTTTFNVAGGTAVPFSKLLGYWFEEFDGAIQIPTGANFLADQGSWMGKFQAFLQWPWYEFFVNTAPADAYPNSTGGTTITAVDGLFPESAITVVGRVNPLPHLVNNGSLNKPKWSMDMSRWNALQNFTLDTASFISSEVAFSAADVRNFYMVSPTSIGTLAGSNNASIMAFVTTQLFYKDQGSINRYGYQPEIVETQWMYDPDGVYAQQIAANNTVESYQQLYNDLLVRVISFYEPSALMASASVTIPLRPDIYVGTTFSYVPFKDGVVWDFYVVGVSHTYQFPNEAMTTLSLSRGLPHTVYTDSALLTAIHTGQAKRQNDQYVIDTTLPGLNSINFTNATSQGVNYSTPQSGKQPTS